MDNFSPEPNPSLLNSSNDPAHTRALKALSQIGLMASEMTDLRKTLAATLDLILETLEVENASIMLLDSESNSLRITAARGLPDDALGLVIPVGKGIAGTVAATGSPILIDDIEKNPEFSASGRSSYRTKSALCVPMRLKSTLMGVISVNNKRTGEIFGENDLQLLSAIAPQIGALIENAGLHERSERKVRELGALFDLARAAESITSLEKFLDECVQIITSATSVETCSIMLLDTRGRVLRIAAYTGTYLDTFKDCLIPLGQGISGKVGETGEPSILNDISASPASDRQDLDSAFRSALSVPMKIQGRVIGVVNVNNSLEKRPFSQDDLRLVTALASQMASSIEKLRLYASMEQKIRELSTVNSVVTKVNSSINLRTVLDMVIDLLVETLGADSGSLMLYNNDTGTLEIEVSRGFSSGPPITTFPLGFGVAGSVAKTRKPALVEDSSISGAYAMAPGERPLSMICAPMVAKDKLLGAICLERETSGGTSFDTSNLELLVTLANAAATAVDNANLYRDLLNIYFETIQSLAAAIEAKDAYTHGHSRRVTEYSLALAGIMDCDHNTLDTIRHAALLHDIGKIGINESILLKPGKLTDEEFSTIRSHPVMGSKILESIDFLATVRAQLKHHHERWDGRGYPDGLKGDQIPPGARIIAVADTFDAMTSTRSYRSALDWNVARDEIVRCSGSQFDPKVVDAFLSLGEEFINAVIKMQNPTNPPGELAARLVTNNPDLACLVDAARETI
ncbi:MAG: hypothetical protein CVV64_01275 [Candidatus Wallbacteria bacterium HGW-Wallbacteria-1]|jgi:putative nucleotidyltransferase with HDIG domain|uniref:Uncharacterized protein n=1 Tax=Candidatus Wallbacteria bacterium HGW-Wallbacteria-1 TaxID=2013854 RepID=A0A2N1PUR2_9BACT|nr:MAG: hypothetical protein CVV64_01275 [Candidatus Wallbacteria bacterium HGW-Wallbacteria-1]